MRAEEGLDSSQQMSAILSWQVLQTADVMALAFLHTGQAAGGGHVAYLEFSEDDRSWRLLF